MIEYSKEQYVNILASLYPKKDANKYSRGCILVIAGSADYTGAAVLSAKAAARTGAGYVILATTKSAARIARSHLMSVPVVELKEDSKTRTICESSYNHVKEYCKKADVILCGPGLKRNKDVAQFIKKLLKKQDIPMVFDADALNCLSDSEELSRLFTSKKQSTIITPHEGEAARLLGKKILNREQAAYDLAKKYNTCVVLKGPGTLICDKNNCIIDNNGGPNLSKAGSGDVLAGMISSILAQGIEPLNAASLAVFLHGKAADNAALRYSDISILPQDIIENVGYVISELGGCISNAS